MKKGIRFIAIYEIIGGVVGIGLIIWFLLLGNADFRLGSVLITLYGVGMYALSTAAGLLMLRRKSIGLTLSRFIQIVQMPLFSIGGLSYLFASGLLFDVYVSSIDEKIKFGFDALLGSRFNITFPPQAQPIAVAGVNLVAVIAFLYLFKCSKDDLEPKYDHDLTDINDQQVMSTVTVNDTVEQQSEQVPPLT